MNFDLIVENKIFDCFTILLSIDLNISESIEAVLVFLSMSGRMSFRNFLRDFGLLE